jgi:ferrous iron transport protein B
MNDRSVEQRTISAVLIGNPNTGKTTLFNALTGLRHRVGNYPGVTVETKTARVRRSETPIAVTDVPGTYSLAPRSPDEMLAVDILLGSQPGAPRPDVVVCIVDASNVERNLYLATQILELGLPVVVALNMIDVAADQGVEIDAAKLAQSLAVPVIPIQANSGRGLKELVAAVAAAAGGPPPSQTPEFPQPFGDAVDALARAAAEPLPRYLLKRALLDVGGSAESRLIERCGESIGGELRAQRARLADAGCPVPAVEARTRYAWIAQRTRQAVRRPERRRETPTDRIDRVLLHPVWGLAVFLLLMTAVFQSIFTLATTLFMDPIDGAFAALAAWTSARMPDGALQSLLVDGVIAGVGGVLVFLPQIVILFGFIAVLEDCGYMARAAFLMDKVMAGCGLSGKSFVPLLSSFACAIPGIMSARTIENRRDRIATVLIAPLMSCSARLPVYTLLIAAFIPERVFAAVGPVPLVTMHGVVMVAMYMIGLVVAPLVAWTLKRTLLRGETPVFLMELPSYKWPSARTVAWRMAERGWAFVRRAGTLILAAALVVWALQYYPRPAAIAEAFEQERQSLRAEQERAAQLPDQGAAPPGGSTWEDAFADVDHREAAAYQAQSVLGRMGKAIEPAVRPLGWDWRIGMAAIASFPAREVVVAALGTIYSVGADVDESSPGLQAALRQAQWPDGRPVFTIPTALSLMVFFALCCQCAATLVVIRRELNSWTWPVLTFIYMTTLAYLASLAVYQIGSRL